MMCLKLSVRQVAKVKSVCYAVVRYSEVVLYKYVLCAVYQPPYLIALLPNCVEVRTIEPRHFIQSIDISRSQCISTTRFVVCLCIYTCALVHYIAC